MNNPQIRQAERGRMSGGGESEERQRRRRGVPHFNISTGAILTLGKPNWRCETLTKFNTLGKQRGLVSPRKKGGA